MQELLQCASVERRCNACGGTYRITLYEMLMEHRTHAESPPVRRCSICSLEERPAMWTIPAPLLDDLERAWEAVRAAADDAGVDLKLGTAA